MKPLVIKDFPATLILEALENLEETKWEQDLHLAGELSQLAHLKPELLCNLILLGASNLID